MERSFRVRTDGRSFTITAVDRDDWTDMRDPCPECASRAFDHVSTSGGRYELRAGAVVRRTDRWNADRSLHTSCRNCGAVLDKHPAYDLLFDRDGDDERAASSESV
ncbi:hypothetical protein [Halobellus rufus]|uniref:hypothetical protein n=1 Tax=Halobellus rufus TaxID=1448860 RepID=UPI000679A7ED|nr:hypothetical protein [Halobellus rufus]